MRILFADPIDPERLDRLRADGHECESEKIPADELPRRIRGFDALVVRSTKVSAETIAAGDCLSLIVRAGAGTDNIDRDAASAAGIYLCNVPGQNAIAVAELTIGLLLSIDRQIADGVADLRAGRWDKTRYSKADGIYGKRLALIGLGDIGLAVAERAKALGMTVGAVRKDDRSAEVQARIRSIGIRLFDSQSELLANADVVSLHVPKAPSTVGLVNESFLAQVQHGAIILNTSRGDVIDEAALIDALDNRGMRAGLDVYSGEPGSGTAEWDSPLARHPRVVGSHHIGASTAQAQAAVADGVINVLTSFAAGRPANCLNLVDRSADTNTIVVRHLDQVGVLAKVLMALREQGHNVQQMQNQVFEGSRAAVATIAVRGVVTDDELGTLAAIEEVLGASAT